MSWHWLACAITILPLLKNNAILLITWHGANSWLRSSIKLRYLSLIITNSNRISQFPKNHKQILQILQILKNLIELQLIKTLSILDQFVKFFLLQLPLIIICNCFWKSRSKEHQIVTVLYDASMVNWGIRAIGAISIEPGPFIHLTYHHSWSVLVIQAQTHPISTLPFPGTWKSNLTIALMLVCVL